MLNDNTITNTPEMRTNHHTRIQIQITSRFPLNLKSAYCDKESLVHYEGLNVS